MSGKKIRNRFRKTVSLMAALLLLPLAAAAAEDSAVSMIPYSARTTLHSGFDTVQPVSDEQISVLLDAAFSMPTGLNQRELVFYVVAERETILSMKGKNPYAWALDTAPCVIVIAADREAASYDGLMEVDAGIAAGALLLQAVDFGLSTCVLAITPEEEKIQTVRNALDMKETILPILMIAIGYPDKDAVSGASTDNWNESQVNWKR